MKYFMGMVLAATALVSSAGAAVAGQYLATDCSSNGQICNNTLGFSFNSDGPGATYAIKLTAPPTHCSDVTYVVTSSSGRRSLTGRLSAGQSAFVSVGDLTKGSHAFRIGAIGHRGGCNVGQLQSWGVTAQETVIPR
jgi:hypothetical protein